MSGLKKGTKYDGKKIRWYLFYPFMKLLEKVIEVLMFGENKYKANNWQHVKNGEVRYLDAAYRHMADIAMGVENDKETKMSHYAHAICCLFFSWWHHE